MPSYRPAHGRRQGAGRAVDRRAACRPLLRGVHGCLVLLLGLSGATAPAAASADVVLPVLSVRGDAAPPAAGAQLGQLSKQAFADLERRWDAALGSLLEQQDFDRLLAERIAPLRASGLDAAMRDEIAGFAGALALVGRNRLGDGRLSLDELWAVQFVPDLVPVAAGSGVAVIGPGRVHGLTNGGAAGRVLVGRNLDWGAAAPLGGLQALTRWELRGRTLVSPGYAGFLGIMNGYNDRGLFAALLAATTPTRGGQPSGERRPIAFALRRALERCTTADCAARLLRVHRYPGSHSVLLADRNDALVLELPAGSPGRVRRADSPTRPEMPWSQPAVVAVVNCLVSAQLSAGCGMLADRFRWQRFQQLAPRFARTGGPAAAAGPGAGAPRVAALREALLDRAHGAYAIFNAATAQSMLFEPASGELLLYAAGAEAAQPPEPVMRRYAGLARRPSGDAAPTGWLHWLLFTLLLALAGAVAGRAWRRRRPGGGAPHDPNGASGQRDAGRSLPG